MEKQVLNFAKSGELKTGGYAGDIIKFVAENQYTEDVFKLLVNQFRLKPDVNNGWRGEFWGKTLRGAALTYRAYKSEKLYAEMVKTVKDLLSVQSANGDISSYPADKEFSGWDMWSRKYVMLGLLYFADICKSEALKKRVISSLKKLADYILKFVGDGKQKSIFETSQIYGGLNSCSILEPFVKLYNYTGEKRYLDFANYIVDGGFCTDMNIIALCYNKTCYPYLFKHTKAYEMMSCFEGLLELYKVTGEKKHLIAVENFADMVLESDYTIVGGSGCTHELFDNSSLKQTEFNPEVAQETCVTVTFVKLLAKLFTVTCKGTYAEAIERSGLNLLAGAVNTEKQSMKRAEGRKWIGDNLIFVDHEPYVFDSYSPLVNSRRCRRVAGFMELQSGRTYGCCAAIGGAGTAVWGLASVCSFNGGVSVNIYNKFEYNADINGEKIKIKCSADPFGKGGAKISVSGGEKTFCLRLRVPSYAEDFCVLKNGETLNLTPDNLGFVSVSVMGGDGVYLSWNAPLRAAVLNGKTAFYKGAVVFARDERLGEVNSPIALKVKNGDKIKFKKVKNPPFKANECIGIKTENGNLTLCDYAQAGKNYDDENCNISVWSELVR